MTEKFRQDTLPSREQLNPYRELLGLQGRVALAKQKYLNPASECPSINEENRIASFEERNYNPFENSSKFDRSEYWHKKVNEHQGPSDFNSQLSDWKKSIIELFNAEKNKNIIDKLTPIFAQIGISEGKFTEDNVQNIYQRYFSDSDSQSLSGVKRFVKDVINSYQSNGTIDYSKLKGDLQEIQWLSNIFGHTSSTIITQLIDMEAKVKTNAEDFIKKVDGDDKRVNNLSAEEKDLLTFIKNHGNIKSSQENGDRPKEETLPILKYKKEIQDLLKDPKVKQIIISAGTGAGKTTQIPQFIEEIMEEGEKMVLTQPRRLPTEDLAGRVASEMGSELGDVVGFRHGEKVVVGPNTPVLFMVEGSLLRQIAQDPLLLNYQYVVIDEWHERHKHTDIVLALLLEAQKQREQLIKDGKATLNGRRVKPLKIVVTSATFDKDKIQKYLPDAAIKDIPGRQYEITDLFEPEGSRPLSLEQMPAKVAEYAKSMVKPGRNLVVFMPGVRLITDTVKKLKELNLPNVEVVELRGALSPEEQAEVKKVKPGIFKIIVATPIAETSITIPHADVISSGYVNLDSVDPETSLETLAETLHSKKGIEQQRGRTGRDSDGTFRFLGTKSEFESRFEHHQAEIIRSDITSEILLLKSMGKEVESLNLIDKPDPKNVARAIKNLINIGALNPDGSLSTIGKEMINIPVDPHLARAIVEAKKYHCVEAVSTIAALYEAVELFLRPSEEIPMEKISEARKSFQVSGSDFLTLLNIWRQFEAQPDNEKRGWADKHFLSYDTLSKVAKAREKLLQRVRPDGNQDNKNSDSESIERCIFEGFKDKLLKRNSDGKSYSMVHEDRVKNLAISDKSVVSQTEYEYVVTGGNYPRQRDRRHHIYVIQNQRVKPEWI